MNFISDFHEYTERRHKEYKNFQPVFCKPLGSYVYFDSDGFRHLRFKTRYKIRPPAEQKYKLDLLSGIHVALSRAELVFEHRRFFHNNKDVHYWAVVGRWRRAVYLRVIIKQTGNGKFHFWSVMKHKK